jgi:acetoacetyl-CoA synthetase
MTAFMTYVNEQRGLAFTCYEDLYAWSIGSLADFWESLAQFAKIAFDKAATDIFKPNDGMWNAQFFVGSHLNYAKHCLRRRDEGIALTYYDEGGFVREYTFAALYLQVAACQRLLREAGVKRGDVVAGIVSNIPEAVIIMLATTAMGAIWSACSPEFGAPAILDRLTQISPKVMFCVTSYEFKGVMVDVSQKVAHCREALLSLQKTWVMDKDFLFVPQNGDEVIFESLPFDHPLIILYSSGTTGRPKCIVHGHGGTLLQHTKELMLHTDLKVNDRLMYVTTCGWMMWNWMVSSLAVGATVVLYNGSPLYPTVYQLWSVASHAGVNVFGASAKYLSLLEKSGAKPMEHFDLTAIKTILSTGSPLMSDSYDYVYGSIKTDVCLSSISGGTDIISCFALGCPLLPVYRGEIQCRGLGMAVEVWDETGHAVRDTKGELVCVKPFPSQPIGFWGDVNKEKYRHTYFEKYAGVWTHGDYAMLTSNGSIVIFGRSDAVLNPGGIRIGTAEIYRVVERFSAILEALAVGQQQNGDERVLLFVMLKPEQTLTPDLIASLKRALREQASPRHVPAEIIAVPDFPRTVNGKVSEVAVSRVVNGLPVTNADALMNPEVLTVFLP